MKHEAVLKPNVRTRAGIRRGAVFLAAFTGCYAVGISLFFGKTLFQAISNGSAAFIVGLAAWRVYHTVSRRNDGLMFVVMGFICSGSFLGKVYIPFVTSVCIGLVTQVPVAWIAGLFARGQKVRGIPSGPADPMYDAEADRPVGVGRS